MKTLTAIVERALGKLSKLYMAFIAGSSVMTLAEVLPVIRQLSTSGKLKLIRILAEDLGTIEDIAPLESLKTYDLPTP